MVLVILDCCYSGSAGMEMLGEALRGIGNPNTWVIASAGPLEYAQQGLFAKAFCDAVRRPTIGASQDFVSLETIVQAVNDAHPGAGQEARLFTPAGGSGGIAPFFPNPAYRPGMAGLTVAEQHWLSRVRGGPEETTTGFYLTGRTGRVRAGQHLAAWMTGPGPGAWPVVTGSPGTGKSALLALAGVADPAGLARGAAAWRRAGLAGTADGGSAPCGYANRRGARTRPQHRPGRGRGRAGARPRFQHRLRAAGGPGRHPGAGRPGRGRGRRRRGDLARHVADQPAAPAGPPARPEGCRGSPPARAVRDRRGRPDHRPGQQRVPGSAGPHRLRPPAAGRLRRTRRHHPLPALAAASENQDQATAAVAAAIARRATARDEGAESFLIGRLLALSVRGRPSRWTSPAQAGNPNCPPAIAEAFDQDLTRLGDNEPLARTLLTALAWAKGPGLPWENIWVPSPTPSPNQRRPALRSPHLITDEDVRWLLDKAGAYIVEDLGPGTGRCTGRSTTCSPRTCAASPVPGQLTPSLPRPSVAAAPRTDREGHHRCAARHPARDGQARDWGRPIPTCGPTSPSTPPPPDRRRCPPWCTTPDFLAVADPVTLTPLLPVTGPGATRRRPDYRRARPLLGDDPHANVAYLQEAALALTGTAAPEGTGIRPLYRTRLASVRRDDSLLTLTGHTDHGDLGGVRHRAGRAAAAGLRQRGRDGAAVGPGHRRPGRRAAHRPHAPVNSVAFGTGPDGRLLLASGGADGTVRLWDPATGAPVGEPLTGHTGRVTSVAFGAGPGGRLLLASGGGTGRCGCGTRPPAPRRASR